MYLKIKYQIDKILALMLLLFLIVIPIIPIIALLIKIEDKGPIFYKQERVGKEGQFFYILKFRSMQVNIDKIHKKNIELGITEALNFKKSVENHYTKIGKFIRITSIDEIPQLINIIRGDMSVIGPRPLQNFEVIEFEKKDKKNIELIKKRNSIKPGLLGFWQIIPNKEDISFENRMILDVKYVDKVSVKTDLKILLKGIKTIFVGNNM